MYACARHAQVILSPPWPITKTTPQRTLLLPFLKKFSSTLKRPSYFRCQDIKHLNCSPFRSRSLSSMGSLAGFTEPLQYPIVRRDESIVDNYHGVAVPDPYRWLEDPDSEEVKQFVQEQVKLTDSVIKKCETREKLHENLTKFYDYPKYTAPFRQADKYFYFHNTGLQPQKVLYIQDSLDGEAKVLLDPNAFSEDGTVALQMYAVSEDAKYMAYGLSASGSDWVVIKVMRIEDRRVEPDTISWVKFSDISWTHDSKGFFYSRYPAPKEGENLDAGTETNSNLDHQVYYHFLGTEQSEDILCWQDPKNPKCTVSATVTEDGKAQRVQVEGRDQN